MKNFVSKVLFTVTLVIGLFYLANPTEVWAAGLNMARIRYDRLKTSTATSLQVTLVPQTVATETGIVLIFPAGTVVGTGQSATTTSLPAGAIALPGTLTAVGSGTSIVVSGVTDLAVGTTYAFNLVTQGAGTGVTTPSSPGQVIDTLQTKGGTGVIDEAKIASYFIANDQVVITANVPPTFSFVLSGNTDAFTSDLTSGSVYSTTGIGLTVSTNAARGWTGWVKSANTALSSVTTGESIGTSGTVNATAETCVAGTDCYVLDIGVTSGSGSGTLTGDPEYVGDGTASGGTLTTGYLPFASRTGKVSNDYVIFKAHATILATKAAGSDYTDTWTIIGAGNF